MDVASIIESSKKDFTRQRTSIIGDFLKENENAIVISLIKKTRGDAIKFYYVKDGKKISNEYVIVNAKTLIQALKNNGFKLYVHDNGTITEYNNNF